MNENIILSPKSVPSICSTFAEAAQCYRFLEAILFVIFMYTVFSTLRVSLFHWNHFSSRATSCASSRFEQRRPMIEVSSAKGKASDEKHTLGRSLIYMTKGSGPSFEPCGAPELIFLFLTELHWGLRTGSDWKDSFRTISHPFRIIHMIPFFFHWNTMVQYIECLLQM